MQIEESEAWSGRFGFDVSSLPAGAYDLEVEVERGGQVGRALNRFNVAWRAESWSTSFSSGGGRVWSLIRSGRP